MVDKKIVEGHEHLARDMNSKAIINSDNSAYKIRKQQKGLAKQKRLERHADKMKIESLESEVQTLKSMMSQIMDKLGN